MWVALRNHAPNRIVVIVVVANFDVANANPSQLLSSDMRRRNDRLSESINVRVHASIGIKRSMRHKAPPEAVMLLMLAPRVRAVFFFFSVSGRSFPPLYSRILR